MLISCGVAQIVIVYVERYKTLVRNCVTVTLFDKDKWSAAIVCVNKYKPSIQNTIMSYVWQRHIGCSYGIYICVIDSSQYSYLIQITVKNCRCCCPTHQRLSALCPPSPPHVCDVTGGLLPPGKLSTLLCLMLTLIMKWLKLGHSSH